MYTNECSAVYKYAIEEKITLGLVTTPYGIFFKPGYNSYLNFAFTRPKAFILAWLQVMSQGKLNLAFTHALAIHLPRVSPI